MNISPSDRLRRCGRLRSGHDELDWASIKLSLRYSNEAIVAGRILDVQDDGMVVLVVKDQVRRAWSHDPESLARIARRSNNRISIQDSHRLLIDDNGDWYAFSVRPEDERNPCSPVPLPTSTDSR